MVLYEPCSFGDDCPGNWWSGASPLTPTIGVLLTSSSGEQCMIIWHIDDLKISHVDHTAVDEVICLLRDKFRQAGPLTVNQGWLHDYLGMILDFSIPGKVQIQMYDFIDKMLADLPCDMDGVARTPVAEHLFTVNPTPSH